MSQRAQDVYTTSMQHHDVEATLYRRHVGVFVHMRKANAKITPRVRAVSSGHPLSAIRIITECMKGKKGPDDILRMRRVI